MRAALLLGVAVDAEDGGANRTLAIDVVDAASASSGRLTLVGAELGVGVLGSEGGRAALADESDGFAFRHCPLTVLGVPGAALCAAVPNCGERSSELEVTARHRDALGFEPVQSSMLGAGEGLEILDGVVERVLVPVMDVMIVGNRSVHVSPDGAMQILDVAAALELVRASVVDALRPIGVLGVTAVALSSVDDDFESHAISVSRGVKDASCFQPVSVQNGWSAVPSTYRPSSSVTRHSGFTPVIQARVTGRQPARVSTFAPISS